MNLFIDMKRPSNLIIHTCICICFPSFYQKQNLDILSDILKLWNAIEKAIQVRSTEAIDLHRYQEQLLQILCGVLDCSFFDNSRMLLKTRTKLEPHEKENYAEIIPVPVYKKRYEHDNVIMYSLLNPEKLKAGYFTTYQPLAEGVQVMMKGEKWTYIITKQHEDDTYDLECVCNIHTTKEKVKKEDLFSVEVQWKGEQVRYTEESRY